MAFFPEYFKNFNNYDNFDNFRAKSKLINTSLFCDKFYFYQ